MKEYPSKIQTNGENNYLYAQLYEGGGGGVGDRIWDLLHMPPPPTAK